MKGYKISSFIPSSSVSTDTVAPSWSFPSIIMSATGPSMVLSIRRLTGLAPYSLSYHSPPGTRRPRGNVYHMFCSLNRSSISELQSDYSLHRRRVERFENDGISLLRNSGLNALRSFHRLFPGPGFSCISASSRSDVAGHYYDRVGEGDCLAVGQPSIVHGLQKYVVNVRMGLSISSTGPSKVFF